jgi:hypothetical protein
MELNEAFPVIMTDEQDNDLPEETHTTWYMREQDVADLMLAIDLAMSNSRIKKSPYASRLAKMKKQFKDSLQGKKMGGTA